MQRMPTLNSLQATAIKLDLGSLETVVGALYHSPSKPFVEDYDKLIRLGKQEVYPGRRPKL